MAKQSFHDIVASDKPTLVDFYATWCGPCKAMDPIIRQLKAEMGDKARVIKIDIDKNPHLAQKLGIRSVPTFAVYKLGKIKWQVSGGQSIAKLKAELEKQM